MLKIDTRKLYSDIPKDIQSQIHSFKDALVITVNASMACTSGKESASNIEHRLVTLLHANQPEKPFRQIPENEPYDDVFGADIKVAVTIPKAEPSLRAIQLEFGINYGVDRVLLVYEEKPDGWHQVLRWQRDIYAEVSGAFGDFFKFVMIPGRVTTPWRVAVAHGHPWPTSRWSSYEVDVLEPSPNGSTPRVVWHDEDGYVREDDGEMLPRQDGFELRLDTGTIESDQMVKKEILRYRVHGDTVQRVPPIAFDGRGFVDAWLHLPWSDAKRWTLPEAQTRIKTFHASFQKRHRDPNDPILFSYGPVQACKTKGRYLVEIDSDKDQPVFYTIQESLEGYMMADVSKSHDASCSGPSIVKVP